MRAWGRLLRLSLAPSALADVAAGAVFAHGGLDLARKELWLALAGSACVYHGGLALNDWADRELDARVRPDRPVPSGAVPARAALVVAAVLLAIGPLLTALADLRAGALLAAVAGLAVLYDLAGRGPWIGPLLLGACRAGNLAVGICIGVCAGTGYDSAACVPGSSLALPPLLYGACVVGIGRVGRFEDAPDGVALRPGGGIVLAMACLACVPFLPHPLRANAHDLVLGPAHAAHWPFEPAASLRLAAVVLVVLALAAPLRQVLAAEAWTRPRVLAVMGMLLRRLLVFTAALALARGSLDGVVVAAAILCGYPLSFALRRVFPPS